MRGVWLVLGYGEGGKGVRRTLKMPKSAMRATIFYVESWVGLGEGERVDQNSTFVLEFIGS